MADTHTREQRSRNMARIRKFGNKSTEGRLVELFRLHGINGWRRHLKLPGRPDFTFRRQRVVVFTDGCFFHKCPACGWTPASNTDYWLPKLARNVEKDRQADEQLRAGGWTVVRLWEHEIKRQPDEVIARVRQALGGQQPGCERGS
jgi:DNA mismatch endonuclease (patch repair protein)